MAGMVVDRVVTEEARAAMEVNREVMEAAREGMEVVEDMAATELCKKKNIVTSKTFFPRIPISNFDFSVFPLI